MSILKKILIFMLKCLKWVMIVFFGMIALILVYSYLIGGSTADIEKVTQTKMYEGMPSTEMRKLLEKNRFNCEFSKEYQTEFCSVMSSPWYLLSTCNHGLSFKEKNKKIVDLNIPETQCAGL